VELDLAGAEVPGLPRLAAGAGLNAVAAGRKRVAEHGTQRYGELRDVSRVARCEVLHSLLERARTVQNRVPIRRCVAAGVEPSDLGLPPRPRIPRCVPRVSRDHADRDRVAAPADVYLTYYAGSVTRREPDSKRIAAGPLQVGSRVELYATDWWWAVVVAARATKREEGRCSANRRGTAIDSCAHLTHEVHVQGHFRRCGAAGAATIAPLSGATHVRRCRAMKPQTLGL
jgi:hypothetical protein